MDETETETSRPLLETSRPLLETSRPLLETSRPLLPSRCFAPTAREACLFGRQGCGFNPGAKMWDKCGI